MCMVSLYMLAILCCHTIDWDIFLRYWCLSQIYYYYYYYYYYTLLHNLHRHLTFVSNQLARDISQKHKKVANFATNINFP